MSKAIVAYVLMASGCAAVEFRQATPLALDRNKAPSAMDSNAAPLASTMPSAALDARLEGLASSIPQEAKLKNGIRVLLIERHGSPIVALGVVLRRGSSEAAPGVFDLFIDSLTSGSDLISPKALHRDWWVYAIHRRSEVSHERTMVAVQFIAPLIHDVVRMTVPTFVTPSFDADEFDDLIDTHRRSAKAWYDEPHNHASRDLDKLLYPPGHPYAAHVSDTEHPLVGVTLENIRALQSCVGADDVAIVVAGDTTLTVITPMLEDAIGALKPGARARKPLPDAIAPTKPHVLLLDHPRDSQAQLALGYGGVKYDNPDFVPLFALSKIVRDGARATLRLAHGVTYAVSAGISLWGNAPAPIVLTAAVDASRVTQAITDTFASIANVETRLAKPGELDFLKQRITANFTTFDTVDESLDSLESIAALDLPVDYWVKFRAAILALTTEDIVRVAKQYLDPTHAQLVVLGDGTTLKPELDALGIAPVEMRKVEH